MTRVISAVPLAVRRVYGIVPKTNSYMGTIQSSYEELVGRLGAPEIDREGRIWSLSMGDTLTSVTGPGGRFGEQEWAVYGTPSSMELIESVMVLT